MKILHINANYTYSTLHQIMIETLERTQTIENHVFMATYDRTAGKVSPHAYVYVCECFRKWDRLLFKYKQNKIQKAAENHYQLTDYDLIHAYTLFTDGNCARNLSKKYGIPYMVAVRNTDVNTQFRLRPNLRRLGVQIMLDAAAVFFLSEPYRKQVFEQYVPKKYWPMLEKKTYIVPNGIDEFWFSHAPAKAKELRQGPVKLIYAGQIDSNKNIPTTQKAMALLRAQGYETTLTVVGKVKEPRVLKIIQQDAWTTYLPAMPKEQLVDAYRSADMFVMPSLTESFGLVYAEAMSQGLPVIYSKGQGFDKQFPEGQVGFAVNSRSPESVAEGIKKVIDNYAEIAARCVPSAEKFHWTGFCREYADIYRRIVHGRDGNG